MGDLENLAIAARAAEGAAGTNVVKEKGDKMKKSRLQQAFILSSKIQKGVGARTAARLHFINGRPWLQAGAYPGAIRTVPVVEAPEEAAPNADRQSRIQVLQEQLAFWEKVLARNKDRVVVREQVKFLRRELKWLGVTADDKGDGRA